MGSFGDAPVRSVADQEARVRRESRRLLFLFGLFVAVILGSGFVSAPQPLSLGILLCSVAVGVALVEPVIGVYTITFFTLLADRNTVEWYPFVANLSSRESMMFISDSLSLNPLELVLAATTIGWILRQHGSHDWQFNRGALFWPITAFTGFVSLALLRAFATGVDRTVALFEARPLFYLLVTYVLVTNLFTSRSQYIRLFTFAFVALGIQSVIAITYYLSLTPEESSALGTLTDHQASVHYAGLFVATLAAYLLGSTPWVKLGLTALAAPTLVVFVLSTRRAAFIAFGIGVLVIAIVLFHTARRRFVVFVPVVAMLTTAYLALYWNSDADIAFGVQAIKSVIAPDDLSVRNESSNLYREIEAVNLWFTIRAQPLQGVGFGNPFYRPWALPQLNVDFVYHWFIPHNSFLWIWLKLGFGGFVALIFMFVRAIQLGARSVLDVRAGTERVAVFSATAFLVMFMVFAYVDIAWGARNAVYLAMAMAAAADSVRAKPGVIEDLDADVSAPVSAQLSGATSER